MSGKAPVGPWRLTTIGEQFYVQLGKRLDAAVNRGEPKVCMTNRSVRWGHVNTRQSIEAPLAAQDIRDLRLLPGDILVCEGGEVGRASMWNSELPEAYYLNTLHRLRSRGGYDPRLLVAILEYWSRSGRLVAAVGQSSIAHLTKENLLRLVIPMPAPDEQAWIANSLAGIDDLLGELSALHVKKREIKKGLTQSLLSGRVRLSGFDQEQWSTRRVADMGEVLAGKALNAAGAGSRRPYLRTKNVLDGRIDLTDVLEMPMTEAEFQRFGLERGDVLLNEGQTLDLVGRCSLYLGELGMPCAMQNQLLRFRAFEWTSPEFAAHLFRYCQTSGTFASIATQTTSVAHLGSSRFSELRLLWPSSRDEQAKIARILDDADREIRVIGLRLAKARAIKLGMMQQLLTGRTRLPVGAAS